jgi:hypothetical protein
MWTGPVLLRATLVQGPVALGDGGRNDAVDVGVGAALPLALALGLAVGVGRTTATGSLQRRTV